MINRISNGMENRGDRSTFFNSTWRRSSIKKKEKVRKRKKRRNLINRGKKASLEQADSKLSNRSTVNSISALTMFIEAHYDFIAIMEEPRHGGISR